MCFRVQFGVYKREHNDILLSVLHCRRDQAEAPGSRSAEEEEG